VITPLTVVSAPGGPGTASALLHFDCQTIHAPRTQAESAAQVRVSVAQIAQDV